MAPLFAQKLGTSVQKYQANPEGDILVLATGCSCTGSPSWALDEIVSWMAEI